MSSERADQPAAPDDNPHPGAAHGAIPHGNPGQVLATQREAMGWSVEQVADQLKLAVRQVVALEAGDYASLPSPAVTRGFVRAYAKLLKIDPTPLVSQIAIETVPTVEPGTAAPRRASPASFSESRFPSHGKRSRLPVGAIVAALVVVVAAAGAGAWRAGLIPGGSHAADTAVANPAAPAGSPADAASGAASAGSATEALQNPSVPLISVPGASSDTAAAPASAPAAAPVAAAPAPAPATPAPAAATPATTAPAPAVPAPAAAAPAAAAAGALVLNVREDSWIEVRPAKGGAPLISRLVKGGSTETVNVDGPVRVTVGNPSGVSATLRGQAVALPPVPGKTISRVNLQ